MNQQHTHKLLIVLLFVLGTARTPAVAQDKESLVVSIQTSDAEIFQGQPIEITATVSNAGSTQAVFRKVPESVFVWYSREGGDEAYFDSFEIRPDSGVLPEFHILKPGETWQTTVLLAYNFKSQRQQRPTNIATPFLEAGRYRIRATCEGGYRNFSAPIWITVKSPVESEKEAFRLLSDDTFLYYLQTGKTKSDPTNIAHRAQQLAEVISTSQYLKLDIVKNRIKTATKSDFLPHNPSK